MTGRRERLSAERQRAALAALSRVATVRVRDVTRSGVAGAVACSLLTQSVASTALGAVLAALSYAAMAFAEQTFRRPSPVLLAVEPVTTPPSLERALATALATTPAVGIPVRPTVGGVTPNLPRQRLQG